MLADAELLAVFHDEATELLGRLGRALLALEQAGPAGPGGDALRELFRLAHTLKGAAASVGRDDLSAVAHALESSLDTVRKGSLAPPAAVISAQLATADILTAALGRPMSADEVARARAMLECVQQGQALEPPPPSPPPPLPPPAAPLAEAPPPAPPPNGNGGNGAHASVRIPVALLDSILYRLDELLATRLRLDFQRRRLEEVQESFDLALQRTGALVPGLRAELEGCRRRVEHVRRGLAEEVHHLGMATTGLHEDVKEVRMVPIGPALDPLRRSVRDLALRLGKEMDLRIDGEDVRVDKRLLELVRDPLHHLLRNALDHGLEPPAERASAGKPRRGEVRISVESHDAQVWISVQDDGRGVAREKLTRAAVERGLISSAQAAAMTEAETLGLLFAPGLSTSERVSEISGRGVGLDVVRENVAQLGGRIDVSSEAGKGTRFALRLPLTLAAARGLMVSVGKEVYCLPLTAVEEVIAVGPEEIGMAHGQLAVRWRDQAIPYARAAEVLGAEAGGAQGRGGPAVVLAVSERRVALGVEELVGQEEIVVRGLPAGVPRLRFVAGATSLADGRLVTVLSPTAVMEGALGVRIRPAAPVRRRPSVVVADDALTTRTLMGSVLERAGYRTALVADGEAALALLEQGGVDALVTDVEMPVLDGLELTRRVRARPDLARLPVILVTSLDSAEDRARGAEAGASAYLCKAKLDPGELAALLEELLGESTAA